mgnify:CR=1 FL=1
MCGTRLYRIWSKMKSRCYNKNDTDYKTFQNITISNTYIATITFAFPQTSAIFIFTFIFNDEPKQDKLHVIAETLNVSEAWLMGYDDEMNKKSYDAIIKELLDLFSKLNDNQQAIIINLMKNMN